ncbi:hypothetical protein TCAL_12064 [Tigriopus californicus]|uniref:C2H2-type domain-containing protein n=1 Tax=Tigriopus californicus TaxID=6832 RepID=A0A553NBG7_TIGCA|nr:zinc finger protein 184-like [Tigriopus californicus]TRY62794.1 hypothetical protein TCAL_12064 [Tigriopus californicus]|eukprot:TCALIF_12064-PA protein Name:"Similar to ZNF91 Zinc finger protein 91 (Homo sapiens)" AED:0.53 eAED:0.53 QI:0/-1/0/1/-1/1/1/0/632
MDFLVQLLDRLKTPKESLSLIHVVVQNWVIFHRDTFDHLDEDGDPYLNQVFLIDVSCGRYIHRAQGHKVDHGTTFDVDVLEDKLTEVFLRTKVCPGFPIRQVTDSSKSSKVVDLPYKRRISRACQYYWKVEEDAHPSLTCPPCANAWQEITAKNSQFDVLANIMDHVLDQDAASENALKLDGETENNLEGDEELDGALEDYEDGALDDYELDQDSWPPQSPKIVKKMEVEKRTRKAKTRPEVESTGKIYKCSKCSECFSSQALLVKHRRALKRKRRAQRKVGCVECKNNDIATFKQLIEHVALMHPDKVGEYEKYLPKEQDIDMMKEPLKCSICDLVSNGSVMNFRHRETYHDLGDYVCSECQEPCLTYYDMMVHNYQKHGRAMDHIPPSSFALETTTTEDGKIGFKKSKLMCQVCLKIYKKDFGLITHMRTKHSWGMFNCKPCGESCHYSKDISAHVVNFHGDNPEVECPNCLEVFNLQGDSTAFEAHYQTCLPSSSEKGPFQCQYCGKEYAFKQTLDAHIKMHQGIIRFKCGYCEYGSNHKHVLAEHEKMHLRKLGLSTEVPDENQIHQCDKCGKQFGNRRQVNKHIRVIHKGIKPTFQCKECGEFLKHSAALYKHKRERHGFVSKSSKP